MGRPLRFAMVTTFYPPYSFGGDAVFVKRLSHELAARGHRVTVIHNADAYRVLAGHEPHGEYDDPPNVDVQPLRTRFPLVSLIAAHQTGGPARYLGALRRLLAGGFDVIHFHNISLMGGPAVLALGAAVKLYTTHEYWLVCPTHVLYRYGLAPCRQPHCWTCALAHRRPPQWWRAFGGIARALRNLDLLLAPSRFAAERHREFAPAVPITHLPNFSARPGSPPSSPGEPAPQPYFLFAGRLERIKGLQTLLPVFRDYRRARLLVAGTGSQEAALRRAASDCGNVVFLGQVTPARLEGLLRGAAALVLPSLSYESCPLVALEALSQATPLIARDIGAFPEILADSRGGFTYRSGAELRQAMDRILDQPGLRRSLGDNGRSAWERLWSPEVHMQRYLGLVDGLLGRKAAASGAVSHAGADVI